MQKELSVGDRVEYRNINLWQRGTVTARAGKWIHVRWDGHGVASKEWAANLERADAA